MRTLIFVRHGNYDRATGILDESGEEQMRSLASRLRQFVTGSVTIFSSPINRVRRSADVLVEALGLGVVPRLLDDLRAITGADDAQLMRRTIENEGVSEIVIVVAHEDGVEALPLQFGFDSVRLDKGQARVLLLSENESVVFE